MTNSLKIVGFVGLTFTRRAENLKLRSSLRVVLDDSALQPCLSGSVYGPCHAIPCLYRERGELRPSR